MHEKHWEKWSGLSKRQLVRPSHACRVNITVFAKDYDASRQEKPSSSFQQMAEHQQAHDMPETPAKSGPPASTGSSSNQPMLDGETSLSPRRFEETDPRPVPAVPQVTFESPEPSTEGAPNTPPTVSSNASLDPVGAQQSLRFRSLPKWEQQMTIKLHKNLGHPSDERLSRALQVNGSRPEVVQAALEIKCAACAAHAPPKHARPASLKSMLDFNHKVYLDGVSWTNNQGKSFHFFHVGCRDQLPCCRSFTCQDISGLDTCAESALVKLVRSTHRNGGGFRHRDE